VARNDPGVKTVKEGEFDYEQVEKLKTTLNTLNPKLFTDYQFDIVKSNDNYKLTLRLLTKEEKKAGQTNTTEYYDFKLHSDFLNLDCDFEFSQSPHEDLLTNSDLLENMRTCNEKFKSFDVVGNTAVVEIHLDEPVVAYKRPLVEPVVAYKIQLDEPVVAYQQEVQTLYSFETFNTLDDKYKELIMGEIKKINPSFVENNAITITEGFHRESQSDFIKNQEANTSGTDKKTEWKIDLQLEDVAYTCEIKLSYYGSNSLSEQSEFADQIKNCENDRDSINNGTLMVLPSIEAYYHVVEPLVYIYETNYEVDRKELEMPSIKLENHQLLGAPKQCNNADKQKVKDLHIKLMHTNGVVGTFYNENIKECLKLSERYNFYKTVLSFDGRNCYYQLLDEENNVKIADHLIQQENHLFIRGNAPVEGMPNCADLVFGSSINRQLDLARGN
jgi:hypothetical protein